MYSVIVKEQKFVGKIGLSFLMMATVFGAFFTYDLLKGEALPVLTGALFFLPPAWILIRARQSKKKEACKLIRNLSAASLGLTALLLTGNFLSVLGSAAVGQMLHSLLAVVSTPMLCSGFWAMSLFLWACLLTAAGSLAKKR